MGINRQIISFITLFSMIYRQEYIYIHIRRCLRMSYFSKTELSVMAHYNPVKCKYECTLGAQIVARPCKKGRLLLLFATNFLKIQQENINA